MDVIFPRFPECAKNAPVVACQYFQCWHCLTCGFYKGDHCHLCIDFSGLCKDCLLIDSNDCRSDYYAMHDKSDYLELDVITINPSGIRTSKRYFVPLLHAISNCDICYFVGEASDMPLGHEIYDESGILLAKLTPVGVCRVKSEIFVNVV